jgi:hypothetical protein
MRNKTITFDMLPDKLVATFFDRFDRSGECWVYKGAKFRKGYGNVHCRAIGNVGAHIISYLIVTKETLYPWDCILHRCDNPPCGNPEHLFKGTKLDNAQDALKKGRLVCNTERARLFVPRGEQCWRAKLTAQQVIEIRKARARGVGQKVLAKRYGVRFQTIQAIDHGKSWKSIPLEGTNA